MVSRHNCRHKERIDGVTSSAGLSSDGSKFYVQNSDQKVEAIVTGVGIGHLPRHRSQRQLDSGELVRVELSDEPARENFLA